jgi:hypothetical protein
LDIVKIELTLSSFACENTHANMERTMSIYEDNIRQLLDSAYSGFGVIELMVGPIVSVLEQVSADSAGFDVGSAI